MGVNNGGKGERVLRSIYKGHMNKTKGGCEVGMNRVGGKWRQLYLNNNNKNQKNPNKLKD